MRLDVNKLSHFNSVTALSVARAFERFKILNAKPSKTAAEVDEYERHMVMLKPFDLDAPQTVVPLTSRRDRKVAEVASQNAGVVINIQKVDAANLSGAQRLTLHRQSAALAHLLARDAAFLTVQERSDMNKLKDSVRLFVGHVGSDVQDSDFKRVTA